MAQPADKRLVTEAKLASELEAYTPGANSAPRGVFNVVPNEAGNAWMYSSYAAAVAAGCVSTDLLIFAGSLAPPGWGGDHPGPVAYFKGGIAG